MEASAHLAPSERREQLVLHLPKEPRERLRAEAEPYRRGN